MARDNLDFQSDDEKKEEPVAERRRSSLCELGNKLTSLILPNKMLVEINTSLLQPQRLQSGRVHHFVIQRLNLFDRHPCPMLKGFSAMLSVAVCGQYCDVLTSGTNLDFPSKLVSVTGATCLSK